jgi:Flp pilus assembly protein TadD
VLFGEAGRQFKARDYRACAVACEAALALAPDRLDILHLLGGARVALGDGARGLGLLAQALAGSPHHVARRIDLAAALRRLGRIDEAIETLRHGLCLQPNQPDLAGRLGHFLSSHGRHAEAQATIAAALASAPDRADLHHLLASEYAADLRHAEALHHLARAKMLAPDHAAVELNLGVVRQGMGELDTAIAHYRRAIELAPRATQPHLNLATALLARLDLADGFAELEHRLAQPSFARTRTGLPRWTGEPLAGRRLLVTDEQGYGDMLQYARFLPRLREFGGEVVVECKPGLERLIATVPGVTACTRVGDPLLPADVAIGMMSLPHVLGCSVADLAAPLPYLVPPRAPSLELSKEGFKVGVVWAAKPGDGALYARRALDRRSCPLTTLAPLAEIPSVRLHSLQKGPAAAELATAGLPIRDLGQGFGDFADTAAAIAAMDLIVSVDTSVAHLAGAMGAPLWVLLAPGQADYRWGAAGERTPWYPAARLYRGTLAGGWPALMDEVAAALGRRVG